MQGMEGELWEELGSARQAKAKPYGFLSNAKAHWLGLVGYKTRDPADIRRPIEQSFL